MSGQLALHLYTARCGCTFDHALQQWFPCRRGERLAEAAEGLSDTEHVVKPHVYEAAKAHFDQAFAEVRP